MITATAAEVRNNFEHFLQAVSSGDEILITQNGKEIARIIPREKSVSFLTDSLTGILKNDYDDKKMKAERIESRENFN